MTGHGLMDRESAEAVFLRYAPLFERLDEEGIDYCLVGGLAVLAHCLANESGRLRATEDADIMVPPDYSNADFAHDFIDIESLEALSPPQEESDLRSRLSDLLGGLR